MFDRGISAMFNPTISDYDIADVLAFHIPAVSSPAGKVEMLPNRSLYFDMNTKGRANDWGRPDDPNLLEGEEMPWLHSDIKDMAYFYVFKFFEKLKEKGELE